MKNNIEKIIKDAEQLGVLNRTKARNIEIRRKFRVMRGEFVKYDEAIIKLSEEYHLSISSIQSIIIGHSKTKY